MAKGKLILPGGEDFPIDNPGEVSDGYHTFNELYEYRMLYNALWINELYDHRVAKLYAAGESELHNFGTWDIHKSWKHSDGKPCFGGGWFIVMVQLPTGQVSNHYEAKDWDKFKIPARDMASAYDGHTPAQAAERMQKYLKGEYDKTI